MTKRQHPVYIYAKKLIDDKDIQAQYARKDGSYANQRGGIVSEMTTLLVAYQIIINDKNPEHYSNNLDVMKIIDKLLPQAYNRECELARISAVSDALDAELKENPLKMVDSYLKKYLDEFDEIFMYRMHKVSDELIMRIAEIVIPQLKIDIKHIEALEKETTKTPAPEVVVVLPDFKLENDKNSRQIHEMFIELYDSAYMGTGFVEKAFNQLKEIYPYLPFLPRTVRIVQGGPCAGEGETTEYDIFEASMYCYNWLSDKHIFKTNPEAKAMLNVLQDIVKTKSLPSVTNKGFMPIFNSQEKQSTVLQEEAKKESVFKLSNKNTGFF